MTPCIPARIVLPVCLLAALMSPGAASAEEPFELRPDLAYRGERSEPVAHEVDFSVVVTAPYHCRVLKVWLPLPQSDFGQDISDSVLTTFPEQVEPQIGREPVYGNRFAYFEFHEPQGGQIIRHRFRATVWNVNWGLDPDQVESVTRWPDSFEPYLEPQQVAQQADFHQLLSQLVPRPGSQAEDLTRVMRWIEVNLTYDHADASLSGDARHAFELRRGHCSDYHGLCATMGRALGYPTRMAYGLALYPKNSPSHCKMEAFLPPYGWVSYDLSETQKLIRAIDAAEELSSVERVRLADAARQRLYRGFRENSWLLVTRGADYDLAPPASQPVRVVRTIYAEADGEPLPEPDPANPQRREFSWMTVHQYHADRPIVMPFEDFDTLRSE